MKNNLFARSVLLLATLFIGAAIAPTVAVADSTTTFSGQATVVQANVAGLPPVTLADTGPLPSNGGSQEASLVNASVPGLLTAEVLHASAVAMGDASRAEAAVANINLTVAGNTIAADFLMARAAAFCDQGRASSSGSSEIVNVVIDGQSITVSGAPNQTIPLPLPGGGAVIINEQSQSVQGNNAEMTVNALHVIIPGTADVVVSHAHADISCAGRVCPQDKDFVTGGGQILANGSKANFGVAGGIKNGGNWGHLTYIDHGAGMKVQGTSVTDYIVTGPTSRQIKGTCEINGGGNYTYTVDVDDRGEPGRDDTFNIQISNGYQAGGNLQGGNIQLHTCK